MNYPASYPEMGDEYTKDRSTMNERLDRFTDIEVELLLSGIEDYTWAIGHRCCHKTKFLNLRKHSWAEICFRVNFFGNTASNWSSEEIEQKWRSLLKTAQDKRESNKNRDLAIQQNQPIFQLIQPLTAIDRKVIYLEEEVAWGTEMNPFLADFDIKFKRAVTETEEEADEQLPVYPATSVHRPL